MGMKSLMTSFFSFFSSVCCMTSLSNDLMIWKYLGTMKPERIFCMQNMNTEKKVCLTFVSFECFKVCSPIDRINPCIASCKFLKGNLARRLSCLLRQHLGTSSTFSFLTSKISVFPFKY